MMSEKKEKKEKKPLTFGRFIKRILLVLLSIIVAVVLIISIAGGLFAYNNLHYDENDMKKVWKAGYTEKQQTLPGGTVLNYAESADEKGEKTPLLLIHGQEMAWEDYARVLPALADTYHVYAVDCHGHGSSSHNPADYTCAKMTEDLVLFIETVIGKPCVVSGHSSGGILTANIAATAPQDVLGIVLEDPPFFSVQPEEMQNTFVWKDGFEVMHQFLGSGEKYYTPYYYSNGYMWKMFQGLEQFPAATAKEYCEKNGEECKKIWYMPYSWTHGLLYVDEYDFQFAEAFYNGTWLDGLSQEEILKGVKCPCTYIKAKTSYGDDGVLYCANDDDDAKKVVSLIPGCKKIETESSDHDPHFVYAKQFTEILERFHGEIAK